MSDLHRYHRQALLHGIGEDGQRRLLDAQALIVGCGALGSCIADTLTRAGVGTITIVDRDLVELTNLQRQILFDENDVRDALPKAEAARRKLARINSGITVNAHVDDFSPRTAETYLDGVDIILDGLDNFETRYLLNDIAVSRGIAYLYGGAVGTNGMTMPILPHPRARTNDVSRAVKWSADQATPCLRCIFPQAPPPGTSPTCDTIGVLGPVVSIVAAFQCAAAIKLLTANIDRLDRRILSFDLWTNQLRSFELAPAPLDDCPCCARGEFEYLHGTSSSRAVSLCGRDAVQITPAAGNGSIDLSDLAERLKSHGSFTVTPFLLRGRFSAETGENGSPMELTLFPDGRAIIKGTTEPDLARTIYARYVGS